MRRIKRTFTQQEKLDIINLVLNDNLTVRVWYNKLVHKFKENSVIN